MRWSRLYTPTLRDEPAGTDAASHRLLLRGGYIRQLAAGHYSLLPLAVRVRANIINVIREEMNAVGGQEIIMPAMHPAEVWQRSGRWDVMGDEMFRLKDRKGADLALGMTHEEIITSLAEELRSYRDLSQIWYQFQTKFRDEPRPKSGLLRTREFTMKDAYSFDVEAAGLDAAFKAQRAAYLRIFERLGIPALPVAASSGAMGGNDSTEFMVPAKVGEDLVIRCPACGYAANVEVSQTCEDCSGDVDTLHAVEVGHIFKLGRKYTEAFGVTVDGPDGEQITPIMGCYGIGVERALAVIVETHHDEAGIIWPTQVAPYTVAVMQLGTDDAVRDTAEDLYRELHTQGANVLLDDRDLRPGAKLADVELIGVPYLVVVGSRSLAEGTVEFTERATSATKTIPITNAVEHVRAALA